MHAEPNNLAPGCAPEKAEPTRLDRRLGLIGAIAIGLGAMVGAGVFTVFAPAARAAGNSLLVGLAIAAAVAYCNATSSAALAAIYPESGGSYVYGRKRLGPFWGFVAGWAFVVGKLASCAAMALVFSAYLAPSWAHPIAMLAVLAATAVNVAGIRKTAAMTMIIVAIVLASLVATMAAIWSGSTGLGPKPAMHFRWENPYGVLQAAGFLFFAFAGYARLATLGEEVIDPRRTIPLAIPIALAIALVTYAAVGITLLTWLGVPGMAASAAPLVAAIEQSSLGQRGGLTYLPRIGATVGSFGVLLSLLVGVSRTVFAMASRRDLPHFFAAVHAKRQSPHRAEVAIGILVATIAGCADVRSAIGFSSFAVLLYYAIANAAALTLTKSERRFPRLLAALGLMGCLALAVTLPLGAIASGVALVAVGVLVYWLRAPRSPSHEQGA